MALQFTTNQIKDANITAAKLDLTAGQQYDYSISGVTLLVATPTTGPQAANKVYVDSVAQGLFWKDATEAATIRDVSGVATTNIDGDWTLSESTTGITTIDGYTPVQHNRILIKSQTSPQSANADFRVVSLPSAGTSISLTLNNGTPTQLYKTEFTSGGGTDTTWSSPGLTSAIDVTVSNNPGLAQAALELLWKLIPQYDARRAGDNVEIFADTQINTTYNITVAQDAVPGGNLTTRNGATSRLQYNGIYTVSTLGAVGVTQVYTRSTDMDTSSEFPSSAVFVKAGFTLKDTGWVCTNDGPPAVGTDSIYFVQFTGAGQLVAGNGIDIAGNSVSVRVDGPTLVAGAGGIKIGDSQVGTLQLTNGNVLVEKLGWQWDSSNTTVSGTTVNSLVMPSATINGLCQGPSSVFVSRNGQSLRPSAGVTVGGAGAFDGSYGTTVAANIITVVFPGYLQDGDNVEVRYMK